MSFEKGNNYMSDWIKARAINVLIAGGGTGGHLFPGIAIAELFMECNPENGILFVNTGKPFEIDTLSNAGFAHKKITAQGIKGLSIFKKAIAVIKTPKGVYGAFRILKTFKPDIVIGVGGYSSGPMVLGAWFFRIRIAIHEQNILPGITNRILSYFTDRIYVSFKTTAHRFNPEKVKVTGNPVRKEIREYVADSREDIPDGRIKKRPFTILVVGGSQGAHSINMIIIEAMKNLKEMEHLYFIHQTGSKDEDTVRKAYLGNEIPCTVQAFFYDMPVQYTKADLIICRAGATTVAEITVLGKAVIFIPFPQAADNHQVLNARELEDAGAAEVILENEIDGSILAERIEHYETSTDELEDMASRSRAFGRPDAAMEIVKDCYGMITE
ncbi:MAG: undecaprenyldiphospho-muramoylpentapeptide beta-N-acetylglucosaminyltransferase [Desulfobacteraceae bacterium]|nr:undecaprenyldiphospho-muramoylpentapeptide beta-N-acetylglucosaminyltransferase [Desulfobacteraceae bacterium]